MSPQELNNRFFLKKIIREYYSLKPLEVPLYIHRREIALQSLEDNVYIRHLSFPSINSLYEYIATTKTPLHLYYSSAYYESPDADKMELKGWLGSDLMFDIDSDHYPGCNDVYSICLSEDKIYEGKLRKCPSTNEQPIIYPVITRDCIMKAYRDALKIVEIIKEEFSLKNIHVYFSGNRGFHVKVIDEEIWDLGSDERREIAEYITLKNIDKSRLFPSISRGRYAVFTNREYGVRKRVLRYLAGTGLLTADYEKSHIIRIPYEHVEKALEEIRVDLDIVVTMDVSRLSRFSGSINGKSGLVVKEIKGMDNYVFNPEDYCPWKGYMSVKPLVNASLPVYDEVFALRRGEKLKINPCIGVYFSLKGIVKIIDVGDLVVENV